MRLVVPNYLRTWAQSLVAVHPASQTSCVQHSTVHERDGGIPGVGRWAYTPGWVVLSYTPGYIYHPEVHPHTRVYPPWGTPSIPGLSTPWGIPGRHSWVYTLVGTLREATHPGRYPLGRLHTLYTLWGEAYTPLYTLGREAYTPLGIP